MNPSSKLRKSRPPHKMIIFFVILFSLIINGCCNSSKDQIIVVYDYSSNTEKNYNAADETVNNLLNQICDYLLDGGSIAAELPNEALDYKRIDVYQTDRQKTDEGKLINIEIYQYNDEYYCKACFTFSKQEYTAKFSADISAQIEKL